MIARPTPGVKPMAAGSDSAGRQEYVPEAIIQLALQQIEDIDLPPALVHLLQLIRTLEWTKFLHGMDPVTEARHSQKGLIQYTM